MSVNAATGRYNVVIEDQYETFEYQIPVEQFIDGLEDGNTYDEVCVIKLGEAFEREDARRLSRAMQDRAFELDRADATIQFAVEGSIQPVRDGFELVHNGELYRLDKVFGADLTERQEGWLTATF